jgi:hypothetical protein
VNTTVRADHRDLGPRVFFGALIGTAIVSVVAAVTIATAVDVAASTAAMLGIATGVTGGAFFGGLAAFATSDQLVATSEPTSDGGQSS